MPQESQKATTVRRQGRPAKPNPLINAVTAKISDRMLERIESLSEYLGIEENEVIRNAINFYISEYENLSYFKNRVSDPHGKTKE